MSGVEWKTEPLGRIARLTMGQSPDSKYYSEDESGWPFLQGCAEFQARHPAPKLFCSRKGKIGTRGAILFSVRAPVGRINVADRDYIIGRGLAAIEGVRVDQNYLEHYLSYAAPAVRSAVQGSTFEAINSNELSAWPVSHPPTSAEEQKIAEILSLVDRGIRQTESLIEKGERIRRGLMHDLLSRGIDEHGRVRVDTPAGFKDSSVGRIPLEWIPTELGRVADIIDPNPSHRYPPPADVGVPIASTEDFDGENDFALEGCETVPWSVFEAQFKRCRYAPSDVVFARKGRLGFARPYGHSEKVFSHTIVLIKAKKSAEAINEFLLWAVRDRQFFVEIDERMNSNSGVPTLGVQFLSSIPLRLPRPEEQDRIASVLSGCERVIEEEGRHLHKLSALRSGLMQDLLTGRRRVTPLLGADKKLLERVS
jgi:type I restriction enzyme, S subunit